MSDGRRRSDGDARGRDAPWDSDWWDDGSGDWAGIASLLVLGLGLGSLFGLLPIGPFWAIFAIGFAVVVPLAAVLEDRLRDASEPEVPSEAEVRRRADEAAADDDSVADALDRLRDRYARGELSDEQFEHKLEVLLETETPEDARERTGRRRRERESPETET